MGEIISFGSWKDKEEKGLKFKKFYDYLWDEKDPFFDDFDLYEMTAYMLLLNKNEEAEYLGQVDSYGRVYCQVPEEELMRDLRCGKTKLYKVLNKLEEKKLLRRERKNKRDLTFFYVREYIPADESLKYSKRTSKDASRSPNEPRDVRQTNDKAKNNNNTNIGLNKIQDDKRKVKHKFGDFSQRQYSSDFLVELEKRMCDSG